MKKKKIVDSLLSIQKYQKWFVAAETFRFRFGWSIKSIVWQYSSLMVHLEKVENLMQLTGKLLMKLEFFFFGEWSFWRKVGRQVYRFCNIVQSVHPLYVHQPYGSIRRVIPWSTPTFPHTVLGSCRTTSLIVVLSISYVHTKFIQFSYNSLSAFQTKNDNFTSIIIYQFTFLHFKLAEILFSSFSYYNTAHFTSLIWNEEKKFNFKGGKNLVERERGKFNRGKKNFSRREKIDGE